MEFADHDSEWVRLDDILSGSIFVSVCVTATDRERGADRASEDCCSGFCKAGD